MNLAAQRELEVSCVASVANLAAVDPAQAQATLDATGVQAQDFTDAHLRAVWAVIDGAVREGRAPDLFMVQARLPSIPRQVLVDALMGQATGSARERLAILRELSLRRQASAGLEAARALLSDTSQSFAVALEEARKTLEALAQHAPEVAPLDGEVVAVLDRLQDVSKGGRAPILETGLEALDAVIGGLQPTLIIVGALPAVGKSALLASIVRNLARRAVPVGVFSLEDEKQWLVSRLLSEASGIPLFILANRPLRAEQLARAHECAPRIHADLAHVIVDDRPALGVPELVASARQMLTRHGVRALFVDHLAEVRLRRSDRHDLDIAEALQQLRALAKVYRVPVVVACHIKRRDGLLQTDEPRLTDFAFSAAVERMARVALALSRPHEGQPTLRVHVLKQTQGKAGVAVDLQLNEAAGLVQNEPQEGTRRALEQLYETQEARMGERP
jgi:replicative DNA helicase